MLGLAVLYHECTLWVVADSQVSKLAVFSSCGLWSLRSPLWVAFSVFGPMSWVCSRCPETALLCIKLTPLKWGQGLQLQLSVNRPSMQSARRNGTGWLHQSVRIRVIKYEIQAIFAGQWIHLVCFCRCGNVNFARRTSCNRCGRGEPLKLHVKMIWSCIILHILPDSCWA